MWKNCKGNRVHNLPDNYIQRKQSKRLLNYIVWMFFSNSLIDSFTYKTIKVLQWNYSVLSTKDEEKIQSNIEVLFSFHLAVVLIETDTNAESIPSHFFLTNYKATMEDEIDKNKSSCSELLYHLYLCSKEFEIRHNRFPIQNLGLFNTTSVFDCIFCGCALIIKQ